MKVLHIIPSLANMHGGPTRAMRTFRRALVGSGVEMEIATTRDRPTESGYLEPAVCRSFPRVLEFYKFSPAFAGWIWRNAARYDLLHIHALFSFTSTAAAWAAQRHRVPFILRPLGSLMRYGVENRRPLLKRASLRLIEGPMLRAAAAVHVTSEEERRQAEALGFAIHCATVPLAVPAGPPGDAGLFYERYPALRGKLIVLFVGRLDPVKNLEALLQAFADCAAKISEVVLVIGGDGAAGYGALLHTFGVELGLGDRLVWTGHLDDARKAAAFAAAEIFVLPSLSESFGIAAAEALMAGLPCVLASGVALAAEAAAAGAALVVEPEATAISAGLQALLAQPERRRAMAQRAQEFAESRYALSQMTRRLLQMYTEAMARSQIPIHFS